MASTARTAPDPVPDPASGNRPGPRERARGALLGLAVGDALGAPAENMKPSEIRARWGRITGYVTDRPSGTDDTEYAIFSGLLLARHGSALTPAHVEAAWHQWIADRAEGPFRGAGFSERGTLENLRRGLAAPISAQHRHAWSDGLAMRAAPFGVFAAGRPGEAARLVAIDGSVSHEGEGIHGGQAVAAGVAAAMAGADPAVVIAAALAAVPDDSWTARSLRRAVAVAHRGERAVRSAVVIGGYPWTDLAPEAVALAFGAYAAADGDFREAVLTAVNMGRDADTTAAVAGALAGATQGVCAIPAEWAAAIGPARGRCLPAMAGHHVLDIAELLVPEEGGKWGEALAVPDFLPEEVRELVRSGALREAASAGGGTAREGVRERVTVGSEEVRGLVTAGSEATRELVTAGSEEVRGLVTAGSETARERVTAGSEEVREQVTTGSGAAPEGGAASAAPPAGVVPPERPGVGREAAGVRTAPVSSPGLAGAAERTGTGPEAAGARAVPVAPPDDAGHPGQGAASGAGRAAPTHPADPAAPAPDTRTRADSEVPA
nr:ADP-ribosylglycohydrolase family protein [Streptomyces sp. LaPpAH-108]